jgi:hypothetical protein
MPLRVLLTGRMTPEERQRGKDAAPQHANEGWTQQHLTKATLLAALYIVSGKVGLLFVPSAEFVTVIWPPSGIALGMLLVYGWRLWPGVLVGSFLLNLSQAGLPVDFTLQQALAPAHLLASIAIAANATLQALAGAFFKDRFRCPVRSGGATCKPCSSTAISPASTASVDRSRRGRRGA